MRLERLLRAAAIATTLALAACGTTPGTTVKKEDAATQATDAARVHTELGQKYLQSGKLELALEKLNKALTFDPNYTDAHTVLAVLYENIGDPVKAEEHYKRAAQLKPKGGNEANNYGAFLCKHQRYDEAESNFQRAIADPFYQTPAVALTNSGTCLLHAGKREEAEPRLRTALDLSPNDGEALFQLSSVLYDKGEYFKARAFMQRFESAAQPRADALMLGRNIELKLGNATGASDYTRRLLQGFPESEQARSLSVQGRS